jgi:hypothetical protein
MTKSGTFSLLMTTSPVISSIAKALRQIRNHGLPGEIDLSSSSCNEFDEFQARGVLGSCQTQFMLKAQPEPKRRSVMSANRDRRQILLNLPSVLVNMR